MSARSLAERGFALLAAGQGEAAAPVLTRAAREGDQEAQVKVAQWRLWGMYGPRDWPAAHKLLASAVARGSAAAKAQHAILYGNGTGVARDWGRALRLLDEAALGGDESARAQAAFLGRMDLDDEGAPTAPLDEPRRLSESPDVQLLDGFLSGAECDWLMRAAAPNLQPSRVRNTATGELMANPVRTSEGMNFGPPIEDLVVQAINARMAVLTETEVGWGEPLHVLRYRPGEEYRPHFDANGRLATVLLYLNDGYGGGQTVFTEVGLQVKGGRGAALIFRNLGADGRLDPLTRHAGLPVQSGEKWLATRWIQPGPYDPWT